MQVEIKIDGEKLPTNDFVKRMVGNSLEGMIESLHGVDGWSEAEVKILKE